MTLKLGRKRTSSSPQWFEKHGPGGGECPVGCRNTGLELRGGADRASVTAGQQEGVQAREVAYPSEGLHTFPLSDHISTCRPSQAPLDVSLAPPAVSRAPNPGHSTWLEVPHQATCPKENYVSSLGVSDVLPRALYIVSTIGNFLWTSQRGKVTYPKLLLNPWPELVIQPADFYSPVCHYNGDILLPPTPTNLERLPNIWVLQALE